MFRPAPEPADPPPAPLDPSWEDLQEICARSAHDCIYPEHGRPALALVRLLDLVRQQEHEAASVLPHADLHDLITPILIGEDDD